MKKTFIFIVLVIIIGLVVYFVFFSGNDVQINSSQNATSTAFLASDKNSVITTSSKTYNHEEPIFSFQYPEDLSIDNKKFDDGTEIITFSNSGELSTGTPEKKGFQIYISRFEDNAPINEQFVRAVFPALPVNEPVEIVFGQYTPGLVFYSQDPIIGKTRELWFAKDSYLYQVTTYANQDGWLAEIFKTWKFQ